MNRNHFPDDELPGSEPAVPVFRVALIDLTTAHLVIAIGEPMDETDPHTVALARDAEPAQPHALGRPCSRRENRRGSVPTRARHSGDRRSHP